MVLLDRKDYEFKVLRHLNDAAAYKPLPKDPAQTIANLVKVTEVLALGCISKGLSDF